MVRARASMVVLGLIPAERRARFGGLGMPPLADAGAEL